MRALRRLGVAMRSRLLALVLLLLPASAPVLAGVKETIATLAPSATVLVVDSKGNELIAQNADKPFVPASVTKIVTSWLALEASAPTTVFETRFYLDNKRVLYIKGGGDPYLISEELKPLATELVAKIGKAPIPASWLTPATILRTYAFRELRMTTRLTTPRIRRLG